MPESAPINNILEILKNRPPTLIVAHNNPDPDCIASCHALKYILYHALKLRTKIAYGGYIGRAENRAMVHHLKIDLINRSQIRLPHYKYIILVDTQESSRNHINFSKNKNLIVIDHHPLRKKWKSTVFRDIRPEYGATSSIITEYFRDLQMKMNPLIATGLYYGIKSDTLDFARAHTMHDFEAFRELFPIIKNHILSKILHPSVPISYFTSFANAVQNTKVYGKTVIIPLGEIKYPDMVAEVADTFLQLEKITWVFCYGVYKSELNISLRTKSRKKNAGIIIKKIAGKLGACGGHEMSAAAQIPLEQSSKTLEDLMQNILTQYLKLIGIKFLTGVFLMQRDNQTVQQSPEIQH
ncbi:MAG: hypothetical protein A2161_05585 [Candidatus Schekmanbacteria bacterium RBG_13_48_7]|uniref:DDH domain-containing protein n=1 Tax=Candidatus Schekmanbacteria bacterium RBG_13_48_7 TaxID=1817878 RepID=A0A1F7S4I9_9BACT|nr:MAG: hypothetical protein A2161_05585 [Candidatus Schekmanbacteria bacterium RBG_13_48_7]